jgi:hypothetical protein
MEARTALLRNREWLSLSIMKIDELAALVHFKGPDVGIVVNPWTLGQLPSLRIGDVGSPAA